MTKRSDKKAIETLLLIVAIPAIIFVIIAKAIFKTIAKIHKKFKQRKKAKKAKKQTRFAQEHQYVQEYDPSSIIDLTETPKYKRKFLLTKREWNFYQALKPVADKLGLVVLSKIRMADLVEPVANNNSQYYQAFGKVKAKHVDFALARPENLYVELLIELDDSTHTPGNERDAFVESVYAAVGYKLLRVRTDVGLEAIIKEALGIKIIMPQSTPRDGLEIV